MPYVKILCKFDCMQIRIMGCRPMVFSITKSNSILEVLPINLVKFLFIGLFDSLEFYNS